MMLYPVRPSRYTPYLIQYRVNCLHLIATDGCFFGNGTFTKALGPIAKDLQDPFRYEVLKMLKAEGKINDAVIENMLYRHHSGFNVYCGPTIWPKNDKGLEDLARYIIRACFSQERMTYLPAKDALDGQATAAHRFLDPIRDLVYGQILSGGHSVPLRLKSAIFALNGRTDG